MPGTRLARHLMRNPGASRRFTHYIGLDVAGLDVVYCREHVFVIPGSEALDSTNRIVSWGSTRLVWYMRVVWSHSYAEEPVELYSELDDKGYETRKVHVFRDGRLEWANAEVETELTWLAEHPIGSIEEISSASDLSATEITQQEFDAIWRQAGGSTATPDG